MKHNKLKISKIVDELTTFCFSVGATEIGIDIKETDEHFKIHLKSNYNAPTEKINELVKLLKCKKQEAMEEYYWYLAGDSDVDSELTLVGMMTDKCKINFVEGEFIEITLYRDKH